MVTKEIEGLIFNIQQNIEVIKISCIGMGWEILGRSVREKKNNESAEAVANLADKTNELVDKLVFSLQKGGKE
ncbi:hypothetical protein BegalDRAFT_3565 [Beggiatoa alba B18LD]|uniref:Uncharacterized protein n=1 Tax=Beggiatoa alba B18LD TaxID=395493 RepID=I3CBD8_9GAMM|nr:hypothetical protein [Beggiatoa alba]EIJ40931.1 hypothetical protein BegalDRAFT_3565 [Beggiatoa alba B18LD]